MTARIAKWVNLITWISTSNFFVYRIISATVVELWRKREILRVFIMKFFFYLFVIIILLFSLISCNDNSPSDLNDSLIANENSTINSEIDESGPTIHYGFPFNPAEIELPADGETITYVPSFVLYSDNDGRKLELISAERQGDLISFFTNETDYFFHLGMTLLTSNDELFISLNAVRLNDNTYKYEIPRYKSTISNDPTLNFSADVRDFLGNNFDENKNYFYILYADVYDANEESNEK